MRAAGPLVNLVLIPVLGMVWWLSNTFGWYETLPNLYLFARNLFWINFGGKDSTGGAHHLCGGKRVLAIASADVGDDAARLPFHECGEALDFVVGVGIGAAEHNRSG